MSSLQEQLLKAGLVDEKKLAQARQEKGRQANQKRKQHGKKKARPATRAPKPQNDKVERDRELNRQRQAGLRQKELAAQATQLIVNNKLDRAQGEQPYSFVYKRKVKKIYLTAEQKTRLTQGGLAIATYVAMDGRKFELVPQAVAEKIRERDESFLVLVEPPTDSTPDENDPYAAFQVPDDLIW